MKQIWKVLVNLWKASVELLFPLRCVVCDKPVVLKDGCACPACEAGLKRVESPFCLKCGKPIVDENIEYCKNCSKKRHLFECGRALYEYDSVALSVYRFKYSGRAEYARFFGREMAKHLGPFIRQTKAEALIPVPLSKKRLKTRGYNQAELLAKEIGRALQMPVYPQFVSRIKETVPQKELNAFERQNNLKKAFKIVENDVKLSTIIVVDDIYTTGSTIDALAEVLLEHGVRKIYFISLSVGTGV